MKYYCLSNLKSLNYGSRFQSGRDTCPCDWRCWVRNLCTVPAATASVSKLTDWNRYIGGTVVKAFVSAGALVSSLDIAHKEASEEDMKSADHLFETYADISSESSLIKAWEQATDVFGLVRVCIALGALDFSVLAHYESSADLPLEQFRRTLEVNVLGTFLTARQWLRGLRQELQPRKLSLEYQRPSNCSLVLIGSESGHWGERGNADYGTSKAAVQYGLLQSLRQDVPRIFPGARVNAIAPGPVNTPRFPNECAENPGQYYLDVRGTAAMGRPVEMESVARACLFLASESWSRDVCGQILNVDSGKLGKVMWKKEESEDPYAKSD